MLEAISWDVDGTLYDLDHFKINLVLRRPWELRGWMAMERVRTQLRREGLYVPDMHGLVVARFAARLRVTEAQAEARLQHLVHESWPKLLRRLGPFRAVPPLLDRLAARGVPMVVASDYPADAKLKALGLDHYPWRAVLDATALGGLKPHPAIFDAAADALQAPREAILHIGDSWELDVLGAKRAGLRAALVGRHKPGPTHPPDLRFGSAKALCDHLAQTFDPRLLA